MAPDMDRAKGIGGSDVAAICGLSPWKTPYQVWEEKLGLRTSQSDNPAMAYGRMMEPVLRQWYSDQTGLSVTVPREMISHKDHPFILASLDGIATGGRVLEIKTSRSSEGWGEPETDEIPVYYMTQIQHYCMVINSPSADVVVSIAGTIPVIYHVPADKELQSLLLNQCLEFWELVQSKIPPDLVSLSDIQASFGNSSRSSFATATQDVEEAISKLKGVRSYMASLESEEEALKVQIMKAMGVNDTLLDLPGKTLATWKLSKPKKKFDEKSFRGAQPELYQQFLKDSPGSRRFLLK